MRVFWVLMGVLVVVAAGVVFAKRAGGDDLPPTAASEPSQDESVDGESAVGEPVAQDAYQDQIDQIVRTLSSQPDDPPGMSEDVASTEQTLDLDVLLGIDDEVVLADSGSASSESSEATAEPVAPAPRRSEHHVHQTTKPDVQNSELAGGDRPAKPVAVESSDGEPVPVVQEQDDGSLLIKGAYVVRGEGSESVPYEMGLDLLVSVQDEYNPRQGQDELPLWLDRFQGKHVRIVGNLLFPLWAAETDEVLLMKNQWDGCCIGVPPTPYDAVEVKLASAIDLTRLASDYGTIEGRFEIDPYIRSNWLLGLYVIEGAKLAP